MAETPYIYSFDGASLSDGQSYRRLSVDLRDERPFQLRRISGLSSLAASLQLYYPGRSSTPLFSAPQQLGGEYLLSPPLTYRPQQSIEFDLGTVARQNTACATTIYTSRLAFQGVRLDGAGLRPKIGEPRPYVLRYPLVIDWYNLLSPGGPVSPLRYFAIEIDTWDFELQRIRIRRADTGAATTTEVALQLFDSTGEELSNRPVLARTINNAVSPAAGWLTPGVLYPVRRQLRFAVESLLCNGAVALPVTYDIDFEGQQWVTV